MVRCPRMVFILTKDVIFCKLCHQIRTKLYRKENREKINKSLKRWKKANPSKNKIHQEAYMKKPGKLEAKNSRNRILMREKARARRIQVIMHYSSNVPKCACPGCTVTTIQFLTIDHIDGCGNEQRKIHGRGTAMYRWIVKNGFPSLFQVLCWNCNACKGIYGKCTFHEDSLDKELVEDSDNSTAMFRQVQH
jgi:hypothetical protein